MTKRHQIYKCEVCGNIVEMLHEGIGELVCCEQPMKLYEENTVDAAVEKHVPVPEESDGGTLVKVGSTAHPMTDEHYIEWIEVNINDGQRVNKHFLKPGEDPQAKFKATGDMITKVRAYCNLHGLWKGE